jgi:uncharacterized membrane protein YcgQ (UPF0703/DUF1980 family)
MKLRTNAVVVLIVVGTNNVELFRGKEIVVGTGFVVVNNVAGTNGLVVESVVVINEVVVLIVVGTNNVVLF